MRAEPQKHSSRVPSGRERAVKRGKHEEREYGLGGTSCGDGEDEWGEKVCRCEERRLAFDRDADLSRVGVLVTSGLARVGGFISRSGSAKRGKDDRY